MTSDGNTQIEKVSASLVKTVTSEDPPVLVMRCEIHCIPRIESYTDNVTLAVSRPFTCMIMPSLFLRQF